MDRDPGQDARQDQRGGTRGESDEAIEVLLEYAQKRPTPNSVI